MALDTYTALQASIASWLDRTDLTAVIPDFVRLAEEQMSHDLAGCPALATVEAGLSLTAGNDTLTLDAGARGLQQIRLLTPVVRELIFRPADELRAVSTSSGVPSKCAVMGGSVSGGLSVRVYPTPDQSCTFDALYASLPGLSDTVTTNFVLAAAPSIYLYGSLLQAAPYLADEPRVATWQALYARAVESFMAQEWTGPVKLRTDVPLSRHAFYDITQG